MIRSLRPLLALLGLALAGSAAACADDPRTSASPGIVDEVESAADGLGGTLWGTEWRLADLAGAGVLDRVEATLAFSETGRAAGNGSCNRFSGAVQISGDSISFGPLASTRMGCAEPISTQEVRYLGALQNAERFVLEGSSLLIHSRGLEKPLRFVRTGP
jgi:heat shock protein HslJ